MNLHYIQKSQGHPFVDTTVTASTCFLEGMEVEGVMIEEGLGCAMFATGSTPERSDIVRLSPKGFKIMVRSLLLALSWVFGWIMVEAQCPPLVFSETKWTQDQELQEDVQQKMLAAIRSGFERYCLSSDFLDPDNGHFSEIKAREFQGLFVQGAKVFNDLEPARGEHISSDRYRDKVLEHFYNTGAEFRLTGGRIESVRQVENLFVASILFQKEMRSGLDQKGRYRVHAAKRPVFDLVMEMHLREDSRSGQFVIQIFSILNAIPQENKLELRRMADVRAGGLTGVVPFEEFSFPWPSAGGEGLDSRVYALNLEGGIWRPISRSGRWYGGLGGGFRQGDWKVVMDNGLQGVLLGEGDPLIIEGRRYNADVYEELALLPGSEVRYIMRSLYLPIGIRRVLSSDLRKLWTLDLELLGGVTRAEERITGSAMLFRRYDPSGPPECISPELSMGGIRGLRQSWFQPFLTVRLSPGYMRVVPAWSDSKRDVGWFLRLDAEYQLLPMLERAPRAQSLSRDITDIQGNFVLSNHSGNLLFSRASSLMLGGRFGFYWKY